MAKKDNDEDDVYKLFTGFPPVSEAKQAVPVTKPSKGQPLQVKKYDQLLSGRSVVTARRGQPTSPNVVSNIVVCLFGGDEWSVLVLIESIGDTESAKLASRSAAQIIKVYMTNIREIEPSQITNHLISLVDKGIKCDKAQSGIPISRPSGTSMSLLIQIREKAFITCIGKCGAIYGCQINEEEFGFLRVENDMEFSLEIPKDDQAGVSYRAPLGFLASDVKTHAFEVPFKTYPQFIALTTYSIPHDSEECSKVYKPLKDIFLQQNPEYIARTLAENHMPMHEDCMTAVLMKHPITKEEDMRT